MRGVKGRINSAAEWLWMINNGTAPVVVDFGCNTRPKRRRSPTVVDGTQKGTTVRLTALNRWGTRHRQSISAK